MNEHRGKCFFVLTLSSQTTVQSNGSDPRNIVDWDQISASALKGNASGRSYITTLIPQKVRTLYKTELKTDCDLLQMSLVYR